MRTEPGARQTCSPLWSNQEAVGHRGMLTPHCVEFWRPLRTSTNTTLVWWYMSIHKPSTEQVEAGLGVAFKQHILHSVWKTPRMIIGDFSFEESNLVYSLCHYLRTSSSLGRGSGSAGRHGSSLEMDMNVRTCVFTHSLMRLRWNFVGLASRGPLILHPVT